MVQRWKHPHMKPELQAKHRLKPTDSFHSAAMLQTFIGRPESLKYPTDEAAARWSSTKLPLLCPRYM